MGGVVKEKIAELKLRIIQTQHLIRILKEEGKRTQILEASIPKIELEITSLEALAKAEEQNELQLWEA
jgi:hypothetical protein